MRQVAKATLAGHNYFGCREPRCKGMGKVAITLLQLAEVRVKRVKKVIRLDCDHDLEVTLC